ncbi:hypothetical protein Tco_0389906 [Tanacetum coccineum]
MDDPNITMEEYIRLEEEKARKRGKEFNWETAKYAIVYNDALTSKLDFLTEPTVSPQHIDEFNLKDETSLSECDEEEQNVLNFNDLFPFNVIYPNDSKSDKDNDDDKVDIEHSSGDLSVKPLPDVINTDVGAYAHGSNKLLETSINTAYPGEWIRRIDFLYSFSTPTQCCDMGSDGYAYPVYDMFGISGIQYVKRGGVTGCLIESLFWDIVFSSSSFLSIGKPCVSDDIHSCLASRFRFSEVVKSSVSEPLVRGSFDVLVGIGRCPRGSFGIVCHERWLGYSCEVMRFGVHGLNVIKVEFRIDLVHGATSVAISLLRCLSTIGKCKKKKEIVIPLLPYTERGQSMEWGGTKRAIQTLKKDLCDASVKSNSGVKDNILLQVRRPRLEKRTSRNAVDLDQQMEKEGSKANVVIEALSRKERVKPRRVRAMAVVPLVGSEMEEAHASSKEWNSGDDQLRLRWMIYLMVLADAAESVRDAIGFEYCLASSSGWTKSPVLWAEIGESSLTGLELVQETTDKVVLVKEKPKAARDRQKSYVDYRRKPLEFEVGDRVLLKVTPWKGVVRFGKKGKLAPRYVGPFEILERIGLVAYRLRLPEELNSVHDTFHVSNLKKCLADANLHVPLDEIKVDKTLRFVEEPVEIMDREIKKLKRRKIALVKVRWNSKRGPEFTWEHEDQMRIKNWKLRFEHSGGLLAGIHGLFSGRNCCLVRRITCGYPWPELEGKGFGPTDCANMGTARLRWRSKSLRVKALVERENVGFYLTKSDLCPSFVEDHTAKGVGLRVADSHTGRMGGLRAGGEGTSSVQDSIVEKEVEESGIKSLESEIKFVGKKVPTSKYDDSQINDGIEIPLVDSDLEFMPGDEIKSLYGFEEAETDDDTMYVYNEEFSKDDENVDDNVIDELVDLAKSKDSTTNDLVILIDSALASTKAAPEGEKMSTQENKGSKNTVLAPSQGEQQPINTTLEPTTTEEAKADA